MMRIRYNIAIPVILVVLTAAIPGFTWQYYEVRQGDTLYRIAQSHGTTPTALKKINGLKGDTLRVGQILQVNTPKNATATRKTSTRATSVRVNEPERKNPVYVVRQGDTINRIANKFDVFADDIKVANSLKNDHLSIGQKLIIPLTRDVAPVAAKSVATKPIVAKPVVAQNVAPAPSAPAILTTPTPETSEPMVGLASLANLANPGTYVSASSSEPLPKLVTPTVNIAKAREIGVASSDTVELPKREQLVEASFQMLGIRYRFGGTSEKTGLDCSAFVKNLFAKFDLQLPRTSREQFTQGEKIAKENLEKGDLVFFAATGHSNRPNHVGIYIGNNQFIHAARKARKVVIEDFNKTWYQLRYLGARRIMELWWEDDEATHTPAPPDDAASTEN